LIFFFPANPRFLAYRNARWEKLDDWGQKTCRDVDKTITQDELDFGLKWELKMPSEEDIKVKRPISFP
jgi:hypothetical protein